MNKRSENGNITYTAGGTIAKGDIVKFSSGKVVTCTGDTDSAIGVALDGAVNGAIVPVAILGAFTGTCSVKATEAVSAGALVNPTGGAAAKGDKCVALALDAATASGDMIECALCVPGYHLDNDTTAAAAG